MDIEDEHLLSLGRVDPADTEEGFCMTVLGIKLSRHCNAVSALHGHVTRHMCLELWPERGVQEAPIGHITNGIHVPTWLSKPMERLYARYLGKNWHDRMGDPKTWGAVDNIDDAEYWEQHQLMKMRLVHFVRRSWKLQMEAKGMTPAFGVPVLNPEALTIGFARRFATYKRGDLLLRDLDRLEKLLDNPERPVQMIYSGKAHPADDNGKELIKNVFDITLDKRFAGKIVIIEDYDMNVARYLVQGVDLWLYNPRRPLEACGTSGQKVVLNGGLNCSVLDGWWAEGYDGSNGFAIGRGDEHTDPERQDACDLEAAFSVLEDEVVPLFYDRNPEGVPCNWVAMIKHAIITLAWRFSAARMMTDYAVGCYLPAAGGLTSSFPAVTLIR